MTPARTRTFTPANVTAVLNSLANQFLIPLLRSTAGGRLGRRLALVEYVGRRTGRHCQLVTMYAGEGQVVRITVGMAEHKTWWRNFEDPRPLQLRLAGVDHDAIARVVREGDKVVVLADLMPPADLPASTGPADHKLPASSPRSAEGARSTCWRPQAHPPRNRRRPSDGEKTRTSGADDPLMRRSAVTTGKRRTNTSPLRASFARDADMNWRY